MQYQTFIITVTWIGLIIMISRLKTKAKTNKLKI